MSNRTRGVKRIVVGIVFIPLAVLIVIPIAFLIAIVSMLLDVIAGVILDRVPFEVTTTLYLLSRRLWFWSQRNLKWIIRPGARRGFILSPWDDRISPLG